MCSRSRHGAAWDTVALVISGTTSSTCTRARDRPRRVLQPALRVVRAGQGRDGHEGRGGRGGAEHGGPPVPQVHREVRDQVRGAGPVRGAGIFETR